MRRLPRPCEICGSVECLRWFNGYCTPSIEELMKRFGLEDEEENKGGATT